MKMTDIFLWPDSEVWRIEGPNGAHALVRVHLSAAAVERTATGGATQTRTFGYLMPLTFAFQHARITGKLHECVGSVLKGEWQLLAPPNSECTRVALPWQTDKPVRLSLQFRNGSTLLIEAASASCHPADDARFIESYAC